MLPPSLFLASKDSVLTHPRSSARSRGPCRSALVDEPVFNLMRETRFDTTVTVAELPIQCLYISAAFPSRFERHQQLYKYRLAWVSGEKCHPTHFATRCIPPPPNSLVSAARTEHSS